jgi:hypothetical protein
MGLEPATERAFAGLAPAPGVSDERKFVSSDPRADGRRREIVLARNSVVFRRNVAGVRMRITLRADAFAGVTLRLGEMRDESFVYQVRLMHRDPDLCVTLLTRNGGNGRAISGCPLWSNARTASQSRRRR